MRNRLFAVVLAFAVPLGIAACSEHRANDPRVWGAFTERSFSTVPMKPGVNVRVFNDVTLDEQNYLKYDKATGYLTLAPGTYRFDGWSLTTFGFKLTAEQQAKTFSAPGYAFLWNVDEKRLAILGSVQDPQLSLSSVLNGVVKVEKTTRFYLGHQNGDNVAGVILEFFDPDTKLPDGTPSTYHAFAQLVVERL